MVRKKEFKIIRFKPVVNSSDLSKTERRLVKGGFPGRGESLTDKTEELIRFTLHTSGYH